MNRFYRMKQSINGNDAVSKVGKRNPAGIKMPKSPTYESLKIIFIYASVGILWILLSDSLLHWLVTDTQLYERFQLLKGWFYVLLTGIVFYVIIKHQMNRFQFVSDELSVLYQNSEENRKALQISEQRYRLILDASNDGIWEWNAEQHYFVCTTLSKPPFHYLQKESFICTTDEWNSLVHPEDIDKVKDNFIKFLKSNQELFHDLFRVRTISGDYRWIYSRGKALRNSDGWAYWVSGSHSDITESIQLREIARKEHETLEHIFNDAQAIIAVIDTHGIMQKCNKYALTKLGYPENELIGNNMIDMIIPHEEQTKIKDLVGMLRGGVPLINYETKIICNDGSVRDVLWNASMLHDQSGNVENILCIGVDNTSEKQLLQQTHQLAYYDALTGLPNWLMFQQQAETAIGKARKCNQKVALIYFDIDNFKHINDTFGHAAGDKILIEITKTMRAQAEPLDLIARISGDQFCILFTNMIKMHDIEIKTRRLFLAISKNIELEEQLFYITFSMGIAIFPDHASDYLSLSIKSDTAMFRSKELGKDQYTFYSQTMENISSNFLKLTSRIRNAIENNLFVLHYQPQIDLGSGLITGVEALIRLNDDDSEIISPAEFIPFSEENGMITVIDHWVLNNAFRQKKIWEESGVLGLKLCLNISGKTLIKENSVIDLKKIIDQYDIRYDEVEFEITETAIIHDFAKVTCILNDLRELGIGVALDDFGTGYSSLTYLQDLPIDTVKVDRSFLANIQLDKNGEHIYRLIVEMAHCFDLRVVAEGIETDEQRVFIMQQGCDIGQGFYFGKPMPADILDNELHKTQL